MNVAHEDTSKATPEPVDVLLFVDDEPNILAALKRLFRPLGYRILTAESGAEGLALLAQEPVDLVISDMRMPNMTGAQFLEQVRLKMPGAVRILLTGYADIGSTIDAINKGQIYRYIAKPWEDTDIVLAVRHALERKHLAQEKARLEALTHEQNEQLLALNASLEEKVRERTEKLRQTMQQLETAHEKLKRNFFDSIRIFSNLIELRGGKMTGHSRRVAELAYRLAQRLGMSDSEVHNVRLAALLHDIGKIGLPDRILNQPFMSLATKDREEFIQHPLKGEAALMGLERLRDATRLVRAHHERFDGQGYPDGISDTNIPLGARILAVVNDYDSLQTGSLLAKRLTPTDALAFIADAKGKRYDPQVAETFIVMMGGIENLVQQQQDIALRSIKLKSGMLLTRDVVTKDGLLLLAKDYVLNNTVINQLRDYEKQCKHTFTVYVSAAE